MTIHWRIFATWIRLWRVKHASHECDGTILGFSPPVITSPKVWMTMSAGGKNLGISRPSASVQSRDDVYTYHKEGDSVVDMHQRFNTLRLHGRRRGVSCCRRQSRAFVEDRSDLWAARIHDLESFRPRSVSACLCCAKSSVRSRSI